MGRRGAAMIEFRATIYSDIIYLARRSDARLRHHRLNIYIKRQSDVMPPPYA